MEKNFYTAAMETKLAETIGRFNSVKSARISLAVPKQSVFVRERSEPKASVVVYLYPGRVLEPGDVKSIVYTVASSVAGLEPSNVTLVDGNSTLLSGGSESGIMSAATSQFEYKRRLEDQLAANIDALLVPIMGVGHSRTNVVAQLDFTELEETTELYDPASQVVRSLQSKEQTSSGVLGAIGIPGALSNQPPTAPVTADEAQTAWLVGWLRVGNHECGDKPV